MTFASDRSRAALMTATAARCWQSARGSSRASRSLDHAADAIARCRIELPDHMRDYLAAAAAASPDPDDPRFSRNIAHVIASAGKSVVAAAEHARARVWKPRSFRTPLREKQARWAGSMLRSRGNSHCGTVRSESPVVILSGGETTVTLRGKGKGGRNTKFLLAFAIGIEGFDEIIALAADTDDIDSSEDNAGAFADRKSVAEMNGAGRTAICLDRIRRR